MRTRIQCFAFCLFLIFTASCVDREDAGFAAWDSDEDGFLDANEYERAWQDAAVMLDWDSDMNDIISPEEWNSGYEQSLLAEDPNLFSEWDYDKDGFLSEDEFGTGMFQYYDSDNDNKWSVAEYSDWSGAWHDVDEMDND